jgi:hypothetical protein
MAVLWMTDRNSATGSGGGLDADERDRARLSSALASLLRNGSAQTRALAADVIGALNLSALEPDLERARKEAGLELERSREQWVKSPPGPGDGGQEPAPGKSHAPSLFSPDAQSALSLWAETTAAEIRMSEVEGPALAAALARDPVAAVRVRAARSVRWLSGNQQWPLLATLLEDADPDVRQAARAELGRLKIKSGPAGDWLLAELKQATADEDPVPLVIASSGFRGLPGLDQALVGALERPDTAPAAATALGAVGDAEAREAILSHLKQPFALALPELLAAIALRPSEPGVPAEPAGAEPAADACRSLLFHTRPEVRAAAVRALLAIAGPAAVTEVQALATDYDVRVRRAVAGH